MDVYTSYYWAYQHGKLPKNIYAVSISQTQPKGVCLPTLEALTPWKSTLAAYKNSEQDALAKAIYTENYYKQLAGYTPKMVWDLLERECGGRDVVLLCYESNDKFCHRHLAADWFTKAGYPVHEYGQVISIDQQRQNEEYEQISFDTLGSAASEQAKEKPADTKQKSKSTQSKIINISDWVKKNAKTDLSGHSDRPGPSDIDL